MKKLAYAFSVAVLCGVVSGCQNTVNTAENAEKSMRVDYITSKNVSTDSFIRDRIAIEGINKANAPGGLLMIQATLRSTRTGFWSETWSSITGANPYKIEYKIDWLDENGMYVDTPASIWKEIEFIPGETKRIQAVSPNARCRDFVINLKEYGK
jgi:hypothetical protein